MKRKNSNRISALCLLLLLFQLSKGQNTKVLYTSHCEDNWFAGLGVGSSVYYGEDIYFNQNIYREMVMPTVILSFGKRISPSIIARGQIGVASLAGESPVRCAADGRTPLPEQVNYMDMNLSLMLDWLNFLNGYKERKLSLICYLGPGGIKTFNCLNFKTNIHLIFKSGGLIQYNLSPAVSLYGDLQGTLVPVSFQQGKDLDYDGYFSVSVGVIYTFKGKNRGFIPVHHETK